MRSFLAKLAILALAVVAFSYPADAAEKLRRGSQVGVDRFVLQNTVNPSFEGYIVVVLAGTEHKIVYQRSPADHETFVAACNRNDRDNPCTVYDPDPVYDEWDLATQIEDGDLTPANRRKWIWAWIYEVHVKKAIAQVEDWVQNLSGLGPAARRRIMNGSYQAWGLAPADAATCAALIIDSGLTCTYSETGMAHVTGRIKRLVDDSYKVVLELP